MAFGPDSRNPREIRSYAHAMIDGHRKGDVAFALARDAVAAALHTPKGQRSGFIQSLDKAAVSFVNVQRYGKRFAAQAVVYRNAPFSLRAGGMSHWYVDAREGLSDGAMLDEGARLMTTVANVERVRRRIVAGMGIAGSALTTAIMLHDPDVEAAWGNDKHDHAERYGYGLHGAAVRGERVWIVDDTATTGDSLVTLTNMVRAEGGIVQDAAVLTDRSAGRAAAMLGEIGVRLRALLVFDERSGGMIPQV